jgi:hypothetical protein
MSDRQKMNSFDWIVAAALLAVGVYLGLALAGLIGLEGVAFWNTVIYVLISFGFVFLFIYYMGDISDRVLNGTKTPASVKRWRRRKPVALLLSLPVGVVIGVVGSRFGLSDLLL